MSFLHALLSIPKDSSYQDYLNYIQFTLGKQLPPQDVQIAQNNFVNALKTSSQNFWTRMKSGYFFHSGSIDGACRVNLKSPSTYLLTVTGTPFFYEGMGTRASSNGYFNQPFKSNEYSGIHTDLTIVQGISHWHEWATQALAAYSQGFRLTAAGAGLLQTAKTDATTGTVAHGGGATTFSNTVSHEGIYTHTYNGTQTVMYRNGTKTTATNSPATPNISNNRFILSYNNHASGGTTALTFYDKFVWGDFLFDRFTDADEAAFRAICDTYLAATQVGYGFVLDYASNCWFSNPPTAYNASANKSWFGQVHLHPTLLRYRQWIFERDNTTGILSAGFELGTLTQFDDHNEPSILIRASDSKLICAYTEHAKVGSPIRWRISTNATDASAWGSESTVNPSSSVRTYTYASIFQDASGNIYIFYRGTDAFTAEWYYIKSTNGGTSFGSEIQIFNRAYTNIYQDPTDLDIFHFIGSPHANETAYASTVVHFYFDAGANTWHKTDGTTLSLPITTSTGTSIFSKTNPERVWFEDLTVDSNGYPRASLLYYPDITSTPQLKHRVYTEWNGSAWSTPYDMGQVMNKNIGVQTLVNTYSGGSHFDPANADRLFASIEVAGRMEMFKVTRLSSSSFEFIQITFNSTYDQWRPIVTESPNHNVYWLGKVFYDHYTNELGAGTGYYQVLVNKTL